MILVDMNQISLASVMMHLNITKRDSVEPGIVRHMILNSLRMYRQSFFEDYGELVICYDSKHYWRRDYYPEYKASRKKTRDSSGHDWDDIFEFLNMMKEEIKDNFPYKVLEVYGAEADDIIATLCHELEFDNGKTLILSGDKDFVQLQKYPYVKQYNPVKKSFVECPDPHLYILEHIIKGDKSDGIPNCLSPDETFVKGARQRPISKKNFSLWLDKAPEDFCTSEQMQYYERNKTLIDFRYIPKEIEDLIVEEYDNFVCKPRSGIYPYFVSNQLLELINHVGDF